MAHHHLRLHLLYGFQRDTNQNQDGCPADRHGNLDQVLFRVFNTLADCVGDFSRFSDAETDRAVSVAHYHKGSEFEDTAAFYGLGYTINSNYML